MVVVDAGRHLPLGPHNLDAQCARAAVKLFDPHENTLGLRFRQDALGNPFGKRFQQVKALCRQLMADRLGDRVIGQDTVNIIIDRGGSGPYFDNDVEIHPLGLAAFGLKCPDLDLDHMIAQRDPVQRVTARCCGGADLGMVEGGADFSAHTWGLAQDMRKGHCESAA